MKNSKLERQEPCAEIDFLCSLNGWDVGHLFWRASRKFAPTLRWSNVLDDVKLFSLECTINDIPEYVWKYMDTEHSLRQREFSRAMAKNPSPVYKRISPARAHW